MDCVACGTTVSPGSRAACIHGRTPPSAQVMVATDRRKVEQQVIEDRLLKKEKDARKDCEVFVTQAFKEELKKRQKFVEELEAQEARDAVKAAENQSDGRGFADMYRNLLNGGLASSRGGEKVLEKAPAREELSKEEVEVLKKEHEAELAAKAKEEALKEEEAKAEEAAASFGVQDVALPPQDGRGGAANSPGGRSTSTSDDEVGESSVPPAVYRPS